VTDRATTLKTAIVNKAQGLARPVTHTAMRATLGVVIVLAVAAALWYAKTAIFLAFAGILLAIVLHGTSSALSRVTGLPHLLSLAIVVVLITGFLAAVFITAGPTIAAQVTQLATSVATGVTNLSKQVVNADKQKLLQDFDITKLLSQFSP
jgi:predicted PurR-regulated permease PerM